MGKLNKKDIDSNIRGLQRGIVEEVQQNPEGRNRILVQISGSPGGLWAGLASTVRPQLGNEVIVGFLQNDPRDPIVLGTLNQSSLPPPHSNNEKDTSGLSFPEGMKIRLSEEKERIIIETTAGNHISLDQSNGSILIEDANNNMVLMSKTGIVLESSRDITFRAAGVLRLEGSNINLDATGRLKTEAAETEITAAGRMVLKGSLVTIN